MKIMYRHFDFVNTYDFVEITMEQLEEYRNNCSTKEEIVLWDVNLETNTMYFDKTLFD